MLDIPYLGIKRMRTLPNNLKSLNCKGNDIKKLDFLPKTLEFLDCSENYISKLDNLPS